MPIFCTPSGNWRIGWFRSFEILSPGTSLPEPQTKNPCGFFHLNGLVYLGERTVAELHLEVWHRHDVVVEDLDDVCVVELRPVLVASIQ